MYGLGEPERGPQLILAGALVFRWPDPRAEGVEHTREILPYSLRRWWTCWAVVLVSDSGRWSQQVTAGHSVGYSISESTCMAFYGNESAGLHLRRGCGLTNQNAVCS